MRYYLLRMSTYGIKNLEKDITLNFYPQTISKTINVRNTNVKAIFGMNGSGKSAIVKSVEMYKCLLTIRNYLISTPNDYFDNLINKKIRSFYFNAVYALYDEKNNNLIKGIYSHSILVKWMNGNYRISEEKLSKLSKKSRTINGEYDLLFNVKDGELYIMNSDYGTFLMNKSRNLLNDSSLLTIVTSTTQEYSSKTNVDKMSKPDETFLGDILTGSMFGYMLNVCIDSSDHHDRRNVYNYEGLENINFLRLDDGDLKQKVNMNNRVVSESNQLYYEKEIKKVERFIKIFKPNLKGISYTKKINFDKFVYNLIFNYDDYSVDSEFESSGIRRLFNLYQYLQYASDYGIVFIDELDTHLHDVYLSKLIQYLINYSQGQLCFTSHNLTTMEELKSCNNSIDFINENTVIVPWRKNGNYSPFKQYRSGVTEGSPFNVEDFDFLSVFGGD